MASYCGEISKSPFLNPPITLQIITTLINFNQRIKQNFSFPFFIIECISKNCKISTSGNLMKACKYLRILQINVGFSHFIYFQYEFFLNRKTGCTALKLYLKISKYTSYKAIFEDAENFVIEFKKIKIWHHISVKFHQHKKFEEILKIMDLSDLCVLVVRGGYGPLNDDMLTHIMQPSIQRIHFEHTTERSYFDLLKFAFEKLPIVSDFKVSNHFYDKTILLSEEFKALLSIKKQTKFKQCEFRWMNFDINANDILNFCEIFMEKQGCLILKFLNKDEISDLIINLQNSKKLLEQANISLCRIIFRITGDSDINF